MDQQGDLLGILTAVLAVAMLAQLGFDYLRTYSHDHAKVPFNDEISYPR